MTTKPRKPRIPRGVTITDDGGVIHFPPFRFPAYLSERTETLEQYWKRARTAFRKEMDKHERFARAYEKWHPVSKYNRARKQGVE